MSENENMTSTDKSVTAMRVYGLVTLILVVITVYNMMSEGETIMAAFTAVFATLSFLFIIAMMKFSK